MDFRPFFVSMQIVFPATAITFVLGLVAASFVCRMTRGRGFLDALFTLPMVMPPTVAGFFLLTFFGGGGLVGGFLRELGISIVFTQMGAIIAAVLAAFPLMYRTSRGALEQLDPNVIQAAETLGFSRIKIFFLLKIPIAKSGILAGTVLAFARALGEFGATIMIAGNIPGRTQTMPIAVFTAVNAGNTQLAYIWVGILFAISLLTILLMNYFMGRKTGKRGG